MNTKCEAQTLLDLAERSDDDEEVIELLRKAIDAGSRELGKDWQTKFEGRGWIAKETRPVMTAMAQLASELRWGDELNESMDLCHRLMTLDPSDNLGIRYDLASCFFESGADSELEKLLSKFSEDESAALKYIKALYYFKKDGNSTRAKEALLDAYKCNIHVPVFLSDVVDMPEELPDEIGIGDDTEAVAYATEYCYLWADTPGALDWMADELGPKIRKNISDPEVCNDIINGLKGIFEG
ncbi:MAG: hypothetical protein SFY67_12170 [Candidatus Melainabacteria bacterium]|nr:hypothetical protein [Candidatus Melainabacteria bacterium]